MNKPKNKLSLSHAQRAIKLGLFICAVLSGLMIGASSFLLFTYVTMYGQYQVGLLAGLLVLLTIFFPIVLTTLVFGLLQTLKYFGEYERITRQNSEAYSHLQESDFAQEIHDRLADDDSLRERMHDR
jgi:ABC-type Fe3+ transport system permease subunit